MNTAPTPRTEDLIVERLDGEVLVYDLRNDGAHALDAVSARVWDACDGSRSVEDLASALDLPTSVVVGTVLRLAELDLVEVGAEQTRRALLRRVAIGAASVPVILSMTAPAAMAQTSGGATGASCTVDGDCASGLCVALVCA